MIAFLFTFGLTFPPMAAFQPSEADQVVLVTAAQRRAESLSTSDWGQFVASVGRLFLDRPYRGKTLEVDGPERLVVNLEAFDCTTFVDSVLAIARSSVPRARGFDAFRAELTATRYRAGHLEGYQSRLHYTSDWGHDAAQRGLVTDVTRPCGGTDYNVNVGFMSSHPSAYPKLASEDAVLAIRAIESRINARKHAYIPQAILGQAQSAFRDGDVIALTTPIEGLDIAHLGFCVWVNGTPRLMHASSKQNRVVISDKDIAAFANANDRFEGVMVFRPRAPGRLTEAPSP